MKSHNIWVWFVPVACLKALAIVLVLGFPAGLLLTIFQGLKMSWAYTEAMALAKKNPAVVGALGAPIESGWFVSGSINIKGPSGDADLAIPISGPKGSGTLYAVAARRAGEWRFEKVEVEVAGREGRIVLLATIDTLPEEGQKEADHFKAPQPGAGASSYK